MRWVQIAAVTLTAVACAELLGVEDRRLRPEDSGAGSGGGAALDASGEGGARSGVDSGNPTGAGGTSSGGAHDAATSPCTPGAQCDLGPIPGGVCVSGVCSRCDPASTHCSDTYGASRPCCDATTGLCEPCGGTGGAGGAAGGEARRLCGAGRPAGCEDCLCTSCSGAEFARCISGEVDCAPVIECMKHTACGAYPMCHDGPGGCRIEIDVNKVSQSLVNEIGSCLSRCPGCVGAPSQCYDAQALAPCYTATSGAGYCMGTFCLPCAGPLDSGCSSSWGPGFTCVDSRCTGPGVTSGAGGMPGAGGTPGAGGAPGAGGTPGVGGVETIATGQRATEIVALATGVIWARTGAGGGFMLLREGTIAPIPVLPAEPTPRALTTDGLDVVFWVNQNGEIRSLNAQSLSPTLIATGQTLAVRMLFQSGNLYFTNTDGSIRSVPSQGGAVTTVASGPPSARGITSDGMKLFWTTNGPPRGVFSVMAAGGTLPQELSPRSGTLGDIVTIASSGGPIFWVEQVSAASTVLMAMPNSGGAAVPAPAAPSGLVSIGGFKADGSQAFYLTADSGVYRFPPPATKLADLVAPPGELAIDNSHVFFIDGGGENVKRVLK